uniref:BTB domain-containing protein n=1 Tax=Panagrolaimus superbus TaxID=310955 RepID=A0A914Y816_9BILA
MDASPVLAAMLESGLKESAENKMYIPDFSFEIVEAAIKLCYNRYIPLNFTLEDILSIYRFADKYQMKLIMAKSTPVYGSESLDKDLVFKIFMNTLCPVDIYTEDSDAVDIYSEDSDAEN